MVKAQAGACGAFFRKSTKCRVLTIKRALSLPAEPFRKEKPLPVFKGHQRAREQSGMTRIGRKLATCADQQHVNRLAQTCELAFAIQHERLDPPGRARR